MKTQIDEPRLFAALPPLGLFRSLAAFLRWLERRREAHDLRVTARALAELDDAILRDIGLRRGSIESALRERAEEDRRRRPRW